MEVSRLETCSYSFTVLSIAPLQVRQGKFRPINFMRLLDFNGLQAESAARVGSHMVEFSHLSLPSRIKIKT